MPEPDGQEARTSCRARCQGGSSASPAPPGPSHRPGGFHPATQGWFDATFDQPTEVQRRGWKVIARGAHALLVAPTGSGKTLAAFLAAIDAVARLGPEASPGVRVLYVSPLKALVYDVERNLRAPLVGIRRTAERLGLELRSIQVDVRTGDTPQTERRRQARAPADILVTTPESLFLVLGSGQRETLATVQTVIVDEIHALAAAKRGVHLALSLERLCTLAERDPQRIGLSATVRPLDEIACYLGGDRTVEVVEVSAPPNLDLEVTVPVPDMENVPAPPPEPGRGGSILGELYAREVGTPRTERGIWSAVYPKLLAEIRVHRSTLVFVNSRALCERLAQRLNDLAGEELVRAHHGSVSHEKRAEIEEGLKAGRIRGIVATSSLELGIDMGAVDRVLLVESPGSVVRGLQRVGRAGHRVGEISAGRIFPKFRGDLLECAVIASRMEAGEIEATRTPRNALDVLAQQIVAACVDRPRTVEEIESFVTRARPYRQLSRPLLEAVLDMLSGRYSSEAFADLRPLLSWDRARDVLSPRRGAAMVSRLNAGTIPDRGNYGVYLGAEGLRVGELDEEMVFETRVGDNILLGATTWRVEEITRDRVVVTPAPGEPGRLPFWRGDGPGRPVELGRALGAFVRRVGGRGREAAVEWLLNQTPLDRFAAQNLAEYILGQKEHAGTIPTDRDVTIERFRDELGDWRVCILSPFGARVHAPWAMALQKIVASRTGLEVQLMYSDDGIVLRLAGDGEPLGVDALVPDPEEVEELVTEQLAGSALFAGLFRENAVRALLLPRRGPGRRTPLWAQRLKAQALLATVQRHPTFPIVLETYRQALLDVFDLPALKDLLRDIRSRKVRVHEVETRSASPFARSLVFAYIAAYIYEQDAPLAERKAQALTLDRTLLTELLGQAELRELIDPEVLAEVEAELQRLAEDCRARDADEAHDLLRCLGDLTPGELADRCTADPMPWLEHLTDQRRAAQITVSREKRWIAAEDAALYRDALGALPPPGLPDALLTPVDRPLERLVRRFARTRGPFVTGDPACRFGLREAQVEPVLCGLETEGVLVRGEIRPGGAEPDWCDAEVLRRLKRRTLGRLRDEVAPVEAATLGLFLPRWHGLGSDGQGPERLLEVVAQLEGLPLSWMALSRVLLPERIAGFQLDHLDMLSASGVLVWVGCGSLGAGDGRIALYRRERAAELREDDDYDPPSPLHKTILDHLTSRGASFLLEVEAATKQAHADLTAVEFHSAVWDLVWAGQITNDTFAPLRSLGRRPSRRPRGPWRGGYGLAGGRWSRVSDLLDSSLTQTQRAVARAHMLLERYGIVSREAARAEELPGGFGSVYTVLKTMEESGRVRRGYFVEGLSGVQFGLAGAVDRLRGARAEAGVKPYEVAAEEEVLILAALDPANPYGTLIPWPEPANPNCVPLRRIPETWVLLVNGLPTLYVSARGRHVITFPLSARGDRGELDASFRALHRLPRGTRRKYLLIEKIDGVPALDSPHVGRMLACGFRRDYRGVATSPEVR